jgi:phage regulator Rha-like protein
MVELDYIVSQVNRRFGFDNDGLFTSRSNSYEIGKAFGKDHSTILFSLQNVKPIDKTFVKQILRYVNEEIRGHGLDD